MKLYKDPDNNIQYSVEPVDKPSDAPIDFEYVIYEQTDKKDCIIFHPLLSGTMQGDTFTDTFYKVMEMHKDPEKKIVYSLESVIQPWNDYRTYE